MRSPRKHLPTKKNLNKDLILNFGEKRVIVDVQLYFLLWSPSENYAYRICCPLCCYRGYKKCEMVPETAIWTANPFCRSTYLLMWVVPSHRTLCCFCPSYWHHLLIGGWLQNQHSAQTTHFVDAFEKHTQWVCFQKQHSVPNFHCINQ